MANLREKINFFKIFKFDKNVAAIAASSRFVVRDVLQFIQKEPHVIVECGSGEGVMTRALLRVMHPKGMLLSIESNKEFVRLLKNIHDSRLMIVEGKAQDIIHYAKRHNIVSADIILASIPFSFFAPQERIQFVRDVYSLIGREGTLVIFHQYSPLMRRSIKKIFDDVTIMFEVRNLLPCFIMVGKKGK